MEELIFHRSDDFCSATLSVFSNAHQMGWRATSNKDHARSCVGLEERRIPLLSKLQRFLDQGEAMCSLSNMLRSLKRNREAATWYQRVRDVGAAHGFFSLESRGCLGLGHVAMEEGRHEEGEALFRHAMLAAELNEGLDRPAFDVAHATGDWRGVLVWEGRMEELIAHRPDDFCLKILSVFTTAYREGFTATGRKVHACSFVGLQERRIPLLGKFQRFRDQGTAMCSLSNMLDLLERPSEAATWYQRARDVGAAHGFFSLECKACRGLGSAALNEGRHEEGLALLRNALAAAVLSEVDHVVNLHP
jgi:hypothetical protein